MTAKTTHPKTSRPTFMVRTNLPPGGSDADPWWVAGNSAGSTPMKMMCMKRPTERDWRAAEAREKAGEEAEPMVMPIIMPGGIT